MPITITANTRSPSEIYGRQTSRVSTLGAPHPFSLLNLVASFAQVTGAAAGYYKIEENLIRKVWDLERGGKTLPADNHEWSFELGLPGTTPESIEGLSNSWIIYRLKATIERGLVQQNVVARKHLRIIRTLDPSDLELSVGMVRNP